MRIHLVAVGKKMPEWANSGFLEFRKRTPPELQIKLVEITSSVRNKTTSVKKNIKEEGERIQSAIPSNSRLIVLDEKGKTDRRPVFPFSDVSIQKIVNNRLNTRRKVDIAIEYIMKNYAEPIESSTLAKLCHLSRDTFARYFRKEVGSSYKSFIQSYRLELAKRKLAVTQSPVQTIAYNVGFDDVSYFNRIFKDSTGLNPTSYRRVCQKGQ